MYVVLYAICIIPIYAIYTETKNAIEILKEQRKKKTETEVNWRWKYIIETSTRQQRNETKQYF